MNNYYLEPNTEITAKVIENIIKRHEKELSRFELLNDYYRNSSKITKNLDGKVITRTGYAKYIVRLNTGYLLGQPVQYQTSEDYDITPLDNVYKAQVIPNMDKKIAKDCSIYGRAFEQIYSDGESNIKSAKIDVRNAFLVRDSSVEHNKLFGVVYEAIYDDKGVKKEREYRITVLKSSVIERYVLKNGNLSSDGEPEEHYFGEVPLIEYLNDDDARGDFEDVLSDIDAYNILKSDRLMDRRKLADAILAISGARLDPEEKDSLMDSMVALLPDGAKMEYVSKNTDETGTDILRRNINDDIHKISMTPDMTDQNFIGNSSGVALAYKILPFMLNNSDKRASLESGLMERFRIYNKFLNHKKLMGEVPTDQVDIIFKNSLPKNDLETSQIINNLSGTGLVDKSTLAAQLSFVQNAEEIVSLAKKELEELPAEANNFGEEGEE